MIFMVSGLTNMVLNSLDMSWIQPFPFDSLYKKDEECWQLASHSFFVSINQMLYTLIIVIYNIDNYAFLIIYTFESMFQMANAAYNFNFLFGHMVWTTVNFQIFTYIFGNIQIYKSKMLFITTKKLERMAKE